jgi:uncharacterized protein (DUF1800 family)
VTTDGARLLVAFTRFGLGPRPGDLARGGDPREAIVAELTAPGGARIDDSALPRTSEALQAVFADQDRKKLERERLAGENLAKSAMPTPDVAASPPTSRPGALGPEGAQSMEGMPGGAAKGGAGAGEAGLPAARPSPEQQIFRAEASARLARALGAPVGYLERLVGFWSNHFCVSIAKGNVTHAAAGCFEREAIRPYVTGRFADMLGAVEQHPAMLNFLDNAQSIGPDSKAGRNRNRGLNENLAREILELHTMGVGSGYTQADVTALAQILTGWTIVGREGKLGEPGTFVFNPNAHEPGSAKVLGRNYDQVGRAQGEAALADTARQGAVADHVAQKFARHFVADDPPPRLTGRLAKTFRDSNGDLGALARALIDDDEAWSAPATKMRNPWEFVVASYRAFNRSAADVGPVLNALNLLGMPLWKPGGPNGFPDEASAWASPEGVKMRVELAAQFARQAKDAPSPATLVDEILGLSASAPTREAVMRAESREQAVALLLMSPEFQRR